MFTGIVEEMGTVCSIEDTNKGKRMAVAASSVMDGLEIGSSVAVNGVCLTAVEVDAGRFVTETVHETLIRTNLGGLEPGETVNLERPMRADGRFDGHVVQGHIDGVGTVVAVEPEGDGRRVTIEAPESLARYIVEKGSVAVDGVSLTVAGLEGRRFEIALIPHTLAVTIFGRNQVGDLVNLEVDIIAKYVERLMEETS